MQDQKGVARNQGQEPRARSPIEVLGRHRKFHRKATRAETGQAAAEPEQRLRGRASWEVEAN